MLHTLADLAISKFGIEFLVNTSLVIGLSVFVLIVLLRLSKVQSKKIINTSLIAFVMLSYGFTFFCMSTIV